MSIYNLMNIPSSLEFNSDQLLLYDMAMELNNYTLLLTYLQHL